MDEDVYATLPDRIADCKVTRVTRAPAEADNIYDHEIAAVIRAAVLTQGSVIHTYLRGERSTNNNLETPSSVFSVPA
jgi:hypothetical protein